MRLNDTYLMVRRAIDAGRQAHGYLIVGPVRGLGMELVLRVLQTLFCRAETRPCGGCDPCRRVAERIEADVHWIFPEKKTRVISANQIRDKLIAAVTQTSLGGGWKAGVIVGADRLNDASANAFLKTLEEPPDKTLFLLLSDAPQQVLPTIVSRCQRIDLEDVRELAEPWRSRVIETLASPLYNQPLERLALSNVLFSILGDMKDKAEQLVRDEVTRDEKTEEEDDVVDAKINARYREMRTDFLLLLVRWFRDLLVLKAGGANGEPVVFVKSKAEVLRERASRLTLAQALYNLKAIDDLARQLERSLPEETALASAIDRMHHGVI